MVTWSDQRSGYYRIYATRVTPDGNVLDSAGIAIGAASTINQNFSAIVYTGSRFFVVWANVTEPGFCITGRFIETNGQPAESTRICTGQTAINVTRIAYDGTNFMLVWNDADTLKGQRIAGSGNPIGNPFVIAAPVATGIAGICFDGTNYMVVWSSNRIWGRKYDRNGIPAGPAFIISNSSYSQASCDVVAGINNRYLNVWSEARTSPDIYGNLDVPIIGIETSTDQPLSKIYLKSFLVNHAIEIKGAEGKLVSIFDAAGKKVGATKNGRFDCRQLECGVYFVTMVEKQFKVIKIK